MAGKITGTGRGRPKSAGRSGSGRHLTVVDNSAETAAERETREKSEAKEREEAEGVQLLSVVSRIKAQDVRVEEARAALKVQTDSLNGIFLNAKAASPRFTRGRLRELANDSKPSERRNVQENEEVRARFRRVMGLPVGRSETEQELQARLPEVEREGSFWFEAGYTAGVTGEMRDAPAACVAAGHDNRFDEGWIAGQAVLAAGMKSARKTPAKGQPPLQPVPEETADERKARERREEKATADALGKMTPEPEPTLDPVQESVKASTEAAAGMPVVDTLADGTPVVGEDFVEATPEELAAQTTRQAIQTVRAASEDEAPPREAV